MKTGSIDYDVHCSGNDGCGCAALSALSLILMAMALGLGLWVWLHTSDEPPRQTTEVGEPR